MVGTTHIGSLLQGKLGSPKFASRLLNSNARDRGGLLGQQLSEPNSFIWRMRIELGISLSFQFRFYKLKHYPVIIDTLSWRFA